LSLWTVLLNTDLYDGLVLKESDSTHYDWLNMFISAQIGIFSNYGQHINSN